VRLVVRKKRTLNPDTISPSFRVVEYFLHLVDVVNVAGSQLRDSGRGSARKFCLCIYLSTTLTRKQTWVSIQPSKKRRTPSQTPSQQANKQCHDYNLAPSILIFHLPPAEFLLSSVALLGALELSQLAGSFQVPVLPFPISPISAALAAGGRSGKLSILFGCTVTVSTSGIQSLSFPSSAREGCECLLSNPEAPNELGMGDLPRVVAPITRGQTVIISARIPGIHAQIMARSVSVVLQYPTAR